MICNTLTRVYVYLCVPSSFLLVFYNDSYFIATDIFGSKQYTKKKRNHSLYALNPLIKNIMWYNYVTKTLIIQFVKTCWYSSARQDSLICVHKEWVLFSGVISTFFTNILCKKYVFFILYSSFTATHTL